MRDLAAGQGGDGLESAQESHGTGPEPKEVVQSDLSAIRDVRAPAWPSHQPGTSQILTLPF